MAKAKKNVATSSRISPDFARSRCSVNSSAASSSRVRTRSSNETPTCASAPRSPPRGVLSGVPSLTSCDGRSATVHQQAGHKADAGSDTHHLPRMVVDVIVGGARGFLGAIRREALELLQLQFCGEELGFDLRPQILRLVAGLVG